MKGYGAYGLLLGALLTGIYGYAAQAAIAADLARVREGMAAAAVPAADQRIWYGGTLAAVTVVAWSPQASAISRQHACAAPAVKG